MAETLFVTKELKEVITMWQELRNKSMLIFKTSQATKKKFVKDFNENDFKAYFEFKDSMQRLHDEQHEVDHFVEYIENYVKSVYGIDLFQSIVIDGKEVNYID